MNTKRGPAKGVSLPKRKAQANAYDNLPENATPEEIKDAAASEALAELEDRVADVRDSWETDSLFEDAFEELSAETTSLDGKFDAIPVHLDLAIWRGRWRFPAETCWHHSKTWAWLSCHTTTCLFTEPPWLPSGPEAFPCRVAFGCSISVWMGDVTMLYFLRVWR